MEYVDNHADSPPRILFAEDDPLLSEDLTLHLTESGYHVAAVATSGEEADERADVSEVFKTLVDEKRATVHRNRLIAGAEKKCCASGTAALWSGPRESSVSFSYSVSISPHMKQRRKDWPRRGTSLNSG